MVFQTTSLQFLKQPLARTTLVEGAAEGSPYPQSTLVHESERSASALATDKLPKATNASITVALQSLLPQQYSSVPTKSKEYDANKAIVLHSQCASTQPRLKQSDAQLKSSMAQNASWSPIALSTSSEQSLVQDKLLKLYE
jgi:hypothetical protein